jgi:hypothetical protein
MKTNKLNYVTQKVDTNGNRIEIKINLGDDHHKGHCYFSITGSIWEIGKTKRFKKEPTCSGAIGDIIATKFPEYEIFERLHLCDSKGAPMFAVSNGIYHFANSSKEDVMKYLRISESEYNILSNCINDRTYFSYMLENLGINKKWEMEANEAIKLLENLTGNEFEDDSIRYHYTPLTNEQKTIIEERIASGYYTAESIRKRKNDEKEAKIKKEIIRVKEELERDINKLKEVAQVKIYVLEHGLNIDNFIYYNHSNEGVFNWKSYDTLIKQEEFDNFMKSIDYSLLPSGITFKMERVV